MTAITLADMDVVHYPHHRVWAARFTEGRDLLLPVLSVIAALQVSVVVLCLCFGHSFRHQISPTLSSMETWRSVNVALAHSIQERSKRDEKFRTAVARISSQIQYISGKIQQSGHETEHANRLAELIVTESNLQDVSPLLIASLVKQESTFKPEARSHKGAQGLMQLMPATTAYVQKKGWVNTPSKAIFDPRTNIRIGATYLRYLEKMFNGDMRLTLIAYNWGPGNLLSALKRGGGIPAGPRAYADRILRDKKAWSDEFSSTMSRNS